MDILREKELWALASAVLAKYGRDAALTSRQRANSARQVGDALGQRIWRAVEGAIVELERGPGEDDQLH